MPRLFPTRRRKPEAQVELPLSIPSSAVYDIVVTDESDEDKAVRIRVGDNVVLELHVDGRLVVPGAEESATRLRWRMEGMNASEARVLLAWHDLFQQQRDRLIERLTLQQTHITELQQRLREERSSVA